MFAEGRHIHGDVFVAAIAELTCAAGRSQSCVSFAPRQAALLSQGGTFSRILGGGSA